MLTTTDRVIVDRVKFTFRLLQTSDCVQTPVRASTGLSTKRFVIAISSHYLSSVEGRTGTFSHSLACHYEDAEREASRSERSNTMPSGSESE